MDALIERGMFPSRSGVIREATRQVVARAFSQATNEKLEAVARAAAATIAEGRGAGIRRIVLYGSVARGEAGEDSDIDLLVLSAEDADTGHILGAVIDVTTPIATATGTTITPIVMRKSEFDRMLSDGFSFPTAVSEEGITLFEEAA